MNSKSMHIEDLRCIGNISNLSCKTAIGVAKNHKIINTITVKDYSACNNCSVYKKYQSLGKTDERDQLLSSCRESCPLVYKEKEDITYVNETNRLKLDDEAQDKMLPKIPLKLYLLFHFMPEIDSLGTIKNLSIIRLADTLNCTTKSIRRSLEDLQEKDYIIYCNSGSSDLINVSILSYRFNHLTKEDGGTGYIKVPNTVLEEVIKADDINYIRLIFRLLFVESKNNPIRGKTGENIDDNKDYISKRRSFISFNELKSYLPDYMNSKPMIINILKDMSDVFYIEFYDEKIIFETKKEIDFVSVKADAEVDALVTLFNYKEYLKDDELTDLTNMSLRYGLKRTVSALSEAVSVYKDKLIDSVENLPGLLTTIIRNNEILALA